MNNQVCLITGGTSGIGKATAIALARKGATVVLAARTQERGERAAADISKSSGNPVVHAMVCDLASQASIRSFAKAFQSRFTSLDVLVHSGAAIFPDKQLTDDGIERNFAIAYLSIFLLTTLLKDKLIESSPSRIVIISGEFHRKASLDFGNLMGETHFSAMSSGSLAALAKLSFASELSRRLKTSGVTVNSLHPGAVRTSLLRHLPWYLRAAAFPVQLCFASPERGACTAIYLASSAEVAGVTGKYFIDSKAIAPSPESQDQNVAAELWDISKTLLR